MVSCTEGIVNKVAALLIFLLTHNNVVSAFSWTSRTEQTAGQVLGLKPAIPVSQVFRAHGQSLTSYDIALNELQALESEPLCHRTAARLLVTNCQLLEGKDEATVLTDSGRKIRDFVDSYAASLAICDLERGRFTIPIECTKLREPALTQLPIRDTAHLHVTSAEIDRCLSGLGASDSAWNTWVSYRHKALRFCEAARADNDKAQNIVLFQRLTKIMSKLADDVDAKNDQRIRDLDSRAQAVGSKLDGLFPLLQKLQDDLKTADTTISHNLFRKLEKSQDQIEVGLENTAQLERMLQAMLKGVMDSHTEVTAMHDQSLQQMGQRATSEMEVMASVMAAAVASTAALHTQIETSRTQAAELEYTRNTLEQGMQRLIDVSDVLASRYDVHTELLQQAQNVTNVILRTLEDTATSAESVNELFLGQYSLTSSWLYLWCPVVSLVMGSYGLPPSMLRNFGLVALGEIAGFTISSLSRFSYNIGLLPRANPSELLFQPSPATEAT